MSRNCYCKFCGRPTDCNGNVCELCECGYAEVALCSDGEHCEHDEVIEEVKPHLLKCRNKDGVYYLKWVPEDDAPE